MAHHEWGWMIVVYLFLGGLGAGSLVLSGVAQISRRRRYLGIARAGALVAPVLVGLGSGLLIFDLGQPFRFWRLFITVNPVSPMSIGSWLLMLFTIIAGCYALLHLPPAWLEVVARRIGFLAPAASKLGLWNKHSEETTEALGGHVAGSANRRTFPGSPPLVAVVRNMLAVIGIPLGLGVGIYTGVLLGAIPARPFWNTPMVAQLFLFSALSTATALLILLAPMFKEAHSDERELEHQALIRADLVFIFLELFIIVPFIVHGELSILSARYALGMIMGGPYTAVFWIGVVTLGILIPLLLETLDSFGWLRHFPDRLAGLLHYASAILILSGGYLLRWVFVHAGQDTHFL